MKEEELKMEENKEISEGDIEIIQTTLLEGPENLQVYNIITSRDPSWQSIIYDLISTEQLDPWNIDISRLCKSYFDKIREMEQNNFFISSKILLAASLLLRIKSEVLLNKYIRDIDNLLFNKKEEEIRTIERIILDENEIPVLSPKTPLPRFKKVTLQELIDALDVAIKTESRRIEKEIQKKQAERLSHVDIPKFRKINLKDRIRQFYAKILSSFKNKKGEIKLPYSQFTGVTKEEKVACFLPMLHLSNQGRLWLEQNGHYSEIWLYLYENFKKNFPDHDKDLIEAGDSKKDSFADLSDEMKSKIENFDEEDEEENKVKPSKVNEDLELDKLKEEISAEEKAERVEEINKDFENPIGDLINSEVEELEDK